MCDPATIALVASAVGTGVSVAGQIQAGNAAQAQAGYTAAVQRNNAIFLERQATDALARGRTAEKQKRLQTSKQIGAQRSAIAAGNVAVTEGSPLDVLEFTASQGELDALIIRNEAEREATGLRFRASGERAGAQFSLLRGAQAKTASLFQAGGTLLGGVSQFSKMKKDFG